MSNKNVKPWHFASAKHPAIHATAREERRKLERKAKKTKPKIVNRSSDS